MCSPQSQAAATPQQSLNSPGHLQPSLSHPQNQTLPQSLPTQPVPSQQQVSTTATATPASNQIAPHTPMQASTPMDTSSLNSQEPGGGKVPSVQSQHQLTPQAATPTLHSQGSQNMSLQQPTPVRTPTPNSHKGGGKLEVKMESFADSTSIGKVDIKQENSDVDTGAPEPVSAVTIKGSRYIS